MRRLLLSLALLVGAAAAPRAAEPPLWQVDDAQSSLRFSFVINGRETEGVFPIFEGTGRFDPAAPGDSSLELRVAVAEVDLGNPIASHFARSPDWFAAEDHPAGAFRLDRVEARPEGRWHAYGTLELRGVSRPVDLPVTLELGEARARATGEAVLDRRPFGIGQGPSAAVVEVSDEIRVTFDLVAEAAGSD